MPLEHPVIKTTLNILGSYIIVIFAGTQLKQPPGSKGEPYQSEDSANGPEKVEGKGIEGRNKCGKDRE
jgi:hypothetical protein